MSSLKTALIQVSDREGEGDMRGDIRRGGHKNAYKTRYILYLHLGI